LNNGYSSLINALVFEPLVSPTREHFWHSRVFETIEPIDHGRVRVRLRNDLLFGDGSRFGPEHVERALGSLGRVTRDGDWLDLELPGKNAASVLESTALATETQSGSFGTGPFAVVSQGPKAISLRRRTPAPRRISQVEMVSFDSTRDAFAAALRGEINLVLFPSDGEIELLNGVRTLKIVRRPSLHSLTLVFNARRLSTAERKEISRSINGTEITNAYGGSCTERPRPVETQPLNGTPLEILSFDNYQGMRAASLALRRSLGARGGALRAAQPSEISGPMGSDVDMALLTLQTWPLESTLGRWVTGSPENSGGYSNSRFDEAIRAGDLVRAKAELEADPPGLTICDLDRTVAVDARLIDPQFGDYDMLDTIPDWEVAP
jgi:hypothetical protein